MEISKKDWIAILIHLERDMSFSGGGTFCDLNKTDKEGDYITDKKEYNKVRKIIDKLNKQL